MFFLTDLGEADFASDCKWRPVVYVVQKGLVPKSLTLIPITGTLY